jgi:hypothetical protein
MVSPKHLSSYKETEPSGTGFEPMWDFEEYSIQGNWIALKTPPGSGDDAQILFAKRGDRLEMGIILGDKEKWFPFTVDATDALLDLIEERVIGTGQLPEPGRGLEDEGEQDIIGY